MAATPKIPTRFLVISDTHGNCDLSYTGVAVDVAIHCGDLTEESKLAEFRSALELLKSIDAPLKLVIPGNHDWTMDTPTFKKKIAEIPGPVDEEVVKREYGDFGEAERLFTSEEARKAGIMLLEQGTHRFRLQNGAMLTVYASPFTPSTNEWGFQYPPDEGHEFAIDAAADIAITHGPPRGVFDYTDSKKRYGCPDLFAAVARARPRMHCFGHMHSQWGAKKVTWRSEIPEPVSHFTAIDNDESHVIESLSGLRAGKFDSPEVVEEKARKAKMLQDKGYCEVKEALEKGQQTLFVNAAVEGTEEHPYQLPWVVDIPLAPATETRQDTPSQAIPSKKRKLEETDSEIQEVKRRA